jgi:hypothetical protein
VLDTRVHTSYPFLFEHDGSVYMLPETSAANELALYRADPFPRTWRRIATLLAGVPVVDASLVEHDGRWWIFATRSDLGDNHSLSIWHATELLGPWNAHRGNPVKTDIRSARSGGTPFVIDGTLYRPAQDGSRTYGGRVILNRVERLTTTEFRETPVVSVTPQRGTAYPDGLHTLSAAGRRTIVDGNVMHLRRDALRRTVLAMVRGVPTPLASGWRPRR